MNQILETVMPYLIKIIGIILGTVLTAAVVQVFKLLKLKVGLTNYNLILKVALSVYYSVEQQFKGMSNVALDKQNKFEELLIKKIPEIKKEDIEHFRESVVGVVNAGIKEYRASEVTEKEDEA